MSCEDGYTKYMAQSVDADGELTRDYALCVRNSAVTIIDDEDALEDFDGFPDFVHDIDIIWFIIAGTMVFLMQAGFAMLEAGSVSSRNTINILFKNLLDACIGAFFFWILGYGFAYGETAGGFIGTSNFALTDYGEDQSGWHEWFFQWAFAATAATIVSGSVAERTKLEAYFGYSIALTAFIYPVVVHWGWGDGWLSAWADRDDVDGPLLSMSEESNGLIDFAGSGIVHMVGGFAGMVGAIAVGPREGRFVDGVVQDKPGHSMVLASLGVSILWFGWFGFNGGSTLCVVECMDLAGKVITNTVLAAASASITTTFFVKYLTGTYNLAMGLNGVIAGLVSITAPCSVVEPWAAFLIGIIGAFVYIYSDKLLLKLQIDDPLSACPLHGFCGIWGLLAVGIFATAETIAFADYPNAETSTGAVGSGEQFGVQLIGALAIAAWTIFTSAIVFYGMKFTIGLRVDSEVEKEGLDASEHGGAAYIGFE